MHVPILLDTALPFAFLFAALLACSIFRASWSSSSRGQAASPSGDSCERRSSSPSSSAPWRPPLINPLAIAGEGRGDNLEAEFSGRAAVEQAANWFRQEGSDGPSIVHAGLGRARTAACFFGVDGLRLRRTPGSSARRSRRRARDYSPGKWILSRRHGRLRAEPAPLSVARYELPTTLTAARSAAASSTPEAISVWSLPGFIETAQRTGLNPDPSAWPSTPS